MNMCQQKLNIMNLSFFYLVQISNVPGPISIAGGGLNGNYIFDQMHFHWASEHTINGGR